jgi:DNA-binding NtrC family response regulator
MQNIRDKSILVIDDDARMLRALDKVLTSEGAVVTAASWAGDAVEILTRHEKKFDLVITDLRMPFVTGLTVVYAVRKIYPRLPVIVHTAFGSPDVKAECFRQGAAAFLEKPLNSTELLEAVQKVFAAQTNQSGFNESKPVRMNLKNNSGEPELNRPDKRRLASSSQDCGAGIGAGNERKEQVYEHHAKQ